MNEKLNCGKSFVKQIQEIQKSFLDHAKKRAKEEGGKIDKKSFEIYPCRSGYLKLRIECENNFGSCFVITRELEMDNDSYIYQGKLQVLNTYEDW